MINEYVLQYIWKTRAYLNPLYTTDKEELDVLYPGNQNFDEGPDFLEAKIKMGDVVWHGAVELHWKSSDWVKHGHEKNSWYHQIILHVVWEQDIQLNLKVPVVALKSFVAKSLEVHFIHFLRDNRDMYPCSPFIQKVPGMIIQAQLSRALAERLEKKAVFVLDIFNQTGDWHETMYRYFFYCMGFKLNSDAMLHLAQQIPFRWVKKNAHNLMEVYQVFYHLAAFVPEGERSKWESTYIYHCRAHQWNATPPKWKFLRTRPSNFPNVRLAQSLHILLQWLQKPIQIWSDNADIKTIYHTFWQCNIVSQEYPARVGTSFELKKTPSIGEAAMKILSINFLPVLRFAYLTQMGLHDEKMVLLDYVSMLPAEDNKIVRSYNAMGIFAKNAGDTQAMLHLKSQYCSKRRCLDCQIGAAICHTALK